MEHKTVSRSPTLPTAVAIGPSHSDRIHRYIRIIINDGVLPLGSKGLYPLPAFDESLRTKAIEFGDFREVCGLNSSVPDKITFLHQ